MKRSVPLTDFIQTQAPAGLSYASFKCCRSKYDNGVMLPGTYTNDLANLRAILVQLIRRFPLKVITSIKEIYLNGALFYTDTDRLQKRVVEAFEIDIIAGKVKLDKKTGTERVKC